MSRTCIAILLVCIAGGPAAAQEEKAIEGWGRFIDPDKDCKFRLDKGSLTIAVPGTPHDLGAERGQMNAPRCVREIEGDFIVQVKVTGAFRPRKQLLQDRLPYHGAGLLLMKDDRTYVRIERATYYNTELGQSTVYTNFELRENAQMPRFGQPDDFALQDNVATYLRLERVGDKVHGAVSQDGLKWHYLEAKTVTLPRRVLVGVAAVNTASQAFEPQFSEFKLFREAERPGEK